MPRNFLPERVARGGFGLRAGFGDGGFASRFAFGLEAGEFRRERLLGERFGLGARFGHGRLRAGRALGFETFEVGLTLGGGLCLDLGDLGGALALACASTSAISASWTSLSIGRSFDQMASTSTSSSSSSSPISRLMNSSSLSPSWVASAGTTASTSMDWASTPRPSSSMRASTSRASSSSSACAAVRDDRG